MQCLLGALRLAHLPTCFKREMTTLHLHIGMHKSGTTSFQRACDKERKALAANGYAYHQDDLSLGENHSYFRAMLERGGHLEFEQVMESALERNECPNYIISGEDLSYLEPANVAFLASVFRAYFEDIRVYAVLRQPIAYMHSATQEILKDPWARIDVLFKRWDVTPSYRRRFEPFIDIFGAVEFIAYGPHAIDELAQKTGIPIAFSYPKANESISRWTAKMMCPLKPFKSWEGAREATARLTAMNPDGPNGSHAPLELVEHWADHVAEDMAWLESIWTPPPGFFDEPPPTVPRSYYETFSIEEVQIIRSLSV